MSPRLLILAALLGTAGCAAPTTEMVECPPAGCTPATVDPFEASLRDHATFDLQCDASSLAVRWLDDSTAEVTGCGRGARYAYIVQRYSSRWLLDSPVIAVAPSAAK